MLLMIYIIILSCNSIAIFKRDEITSIERIQLSQQFSISNCQDGLEDFKDKEDIALQTFKDAEDRR